MKHHSIVIRYLYMVLALVLGLPATMQAAQPQDDNTSPYFESAAVRDSFMNSEKPI